MDSKEQSADRLVLITRPAVMVWAIIGFEILLSLSAARFSWGNTHVGILVSAGFFALICFTALVFPYYSTLVIDRSLGTLRISHHDVLGLGLLHRTVKITDIADFQDSFGRNRGGSTVYFRFMIRDGQRLLFSCSRPHYTDGWQKRQTVEQTAYAPLVRKLLKTA